MDNSPKLTYVNTSSNKRIEWVDALRALAIIFVVFGHCLGTYGTPFFVFMEPIQITVFFLITGFFLKPGGGTTQSLIRFLILRLIVPWVFLTFIWLKIPILLALGDIDSVKDSIYLMVSGGLEWYMNCCIIANVITFLSFKICKNFKVGCALLFALGIAGLTLSNYNILDFAKFNRALTVQLYLLMGILLRRYWEKIGKLPAWTVIAAIIVYILLVVFSCVFYPGQSLDVNANVYYNYLVCFAMILTGCYALVRIFSSLQFPKWFITIGKYTLVIYLLQGRMISVISYFLNFCNLTIRGNYLVSLISAVFIIASATLTGIFLNKYFPVLIGNKARKNERERKAFHNAREEFLKK